MTLSNKHLLPCLAIGLTLFYALLLPFHAALGPVDDHELLATIQSGHWLPFYIEPAIGRFYPLDGQEYNLIALVSRSPVAYYTFNALELLCFAALFYRIMRSVASRNWSSIALIALLLSPGLVTAWFRLQVPERNELFLFTLFLAAYLRYLSKGTATGFAVALLAATAALYEKETAFILLGTFAFFRLVLTRRTVKNVSRPLDLCLLASAASYLLVYFFVVFLHRGAVLYAPDPRGFWWTLCKNIGGYVISDPVLFFILLPLALWRCTQVCLRRSQGHPLYDPMLFAAALYAVAYFKLNLSNVYYWLPAYLFAAPSLAHFARQAKTITGWQRAWLKASGFSVAALLASAVIPTAIYLVIFSKYVPANYQRLLDFMQQTLQQQPAGRARIFLEGVNSGDGVELYVSLGRYLNARGIGNNRFDLLTDVPTDNPLLSRVSGSPYRVFRQQAAERVQPGDYVIVTPYSQERFMAISRAEAAHYRLLFSTHSRFAMPDITLRSELKRLLLQPADPKTGTPLAIHPMEYSVYRRL